MYESGKIWFEPDLIYVVNCVAFLIDKYLYCLTIAFINTT